MKEFILKKIFTLGLEREQLDTLEAQEENLMMIGLIKQEIARNDGAMDLYRRIAEQNGWT
ncbi:hypothetical protein [Falsirhodobacter xinxiangensis]|uniref:hypothetical protein n=1 Tax=Falsirhodobacter xinxiangensis TaxID=2530049 RepID=UPI0010AA74D4|nr:hypothetical protein [Rhodobacter xinxiangensis]